MKTLKEKAKEIRGILKEKGIKASVRMSSGSAIQIYIQDLAADYEVVREIARSFENISRCEFSGEILSGGNDYVFVRYDYDTLKEASKNYMNLAEQYLAEIEEGNGRYFIPIAEFQGNEFLLAPDRGGPTLIMNTDERQRAWGYAAYNKQSLADGLAVIDARYELGLLEDVSVITAPDVLASLTNTEVTIQ